MNEKEHRSTNEPVPEPEGKEINQLVDEVLSYMAIIKKKLIGDDFETLSAKMYNIETYEPQKCPECGKPRQKFFLLLQPGDDLFDASSSPAGRSITGWRLFCLDCTKKINVIPKK
nr:hypothetical protein [Candidatus Sigynarchaeota archaeon]